MFKLAVFGSKQRQKKFSLSESCTSPSSAFDTKPNFGLFEGSNLNVNKFDRGAYC
jgi:hypothetical protein